MICVFSGCGTAKAENLMNGIEPNTVAPIEVDEKFKNSYLSFSTELFKNVYNSSGDNVVLSPMSLQNVLAMLMNGAEGETLSQMEEVLGISRDEMNNYMYSFMSEQYIDNFKSANSVWFKNDGKSFKANKDFLQKNADYYRAELFASEFNQKTVDNVNKWVNNKTDGLIDHIIDEFSPDSVMLLINAILFDAEWQSKYLETQVKTFDFTNAEGVVKNVPCLVSTELYYIKTANEVGVRKNYKGGKYSFVALLPNEKTDIDTYINGLTAEGLENALSNTYKRDVITKIPKFSARTNVDLIKVLSDMGMKTAFSSMADFSSLGESDYGNIYIDGLAQKAYIKLDERGTKAVAVTHSDLAITSGSIEPDPIVYLDRPFVYMIVDNSTNIPIFIGAITDL